MLIINKLPPVDDMLKHVHFIFEYHSSNDNIVIVWIDSRCGQQQRGGLVH